MLNKILLGLGFLFIPFLNHAIDNGPQTIACDYKFGNQEGTTTCLIVGSGMNQGIGWSVFEVRGKRFRYSDDFPEKIELLDSENQFMRDYPVTNSYESCRPGGTDADIYSFANGDKVCLYW